MTTPTPRPRGRPGRPPGDPELVGVPLGIKLPKWLASWLRAQPESHARLIEDALRTVHKIEPPANPINHRRQKRIEVGLTASQLASALRIKESDLRAFEDGGELPEEAHREWARLTKLLTIAISQKKEGILNE